ncbi:hypothetical protein DOTSEDRAFT_116321, partial [Dothistroma septosporum NZE10]
SCAFCRIADAYPADRSSPVPTAAAADPEKVDPQCHLILSTPLVLAFLDIMPISPGHILLTTRKHYRKLTVATSQALGEYLPVISRALCKVTGIEDWNVVQNNGERAAQVVPHVHFHLIPRYQEGREEMRRNGRTDWGALKSWRMFGRGSREDLDDEEGAKLAGEMRRALREELGERKE